MHLSVTVAAFQESTSWIYIKYLMGCITKIIEFHKEKGNINNASYNIGTKQCHFHDLVRSVKM